MFQHITSVPDPNRFVDELNKWVQSSVMLRNYFAGQDPVPIQFTYDKVRQRVGLLFHDTTPGFENNKIALSKLLCTK